jgi:hypothetical protein
MKMKSIIIISLAIFLSTVAILLWWPVSGEVHLIGSGFAKDGGSLSVSYEKNGTKVICVIDSRTRVGTGKIFIGGYPEKEGAREIRFLEIFEVYRDVGKIVNSDEYQKTIETKIDHKETISNPTIANEWKRQQHYKNAKYFRSALLLRTVFMPAIKLFYNYMNERDRSEGK